MPFKAQKTHELVNSAKEWTSQKVRIVKAATKSKEAFTQAFSKERLQKSIAKMRGKRQYQHQVAKPVAKTVVADDEWFCMKQVCNALRKCCYYVRHGEMPVLKPQTLLQHVGHADKGQFVAGQRRVGNCRL